MEKKIIEFLKDGEKSTSDISSLINRNYYDTIKILEKLLSEGKVIKIEVSKYTFWKLNKEGTENEEVFTAD